MFFCTVTQVTMPGKDSDKFGDHSTGLRKSSGTQVGDLWFLKVANQNQVEQDLAWNWRNRQSMKSIQKEAMSLWLFHWLTLGGGELNWLPLCLISATKHLFIEYASTPRLQCKWSFWAGHPIQLRSLYSITDLLCPRFLKYNIYLTIFISWTCHAINRDSHVYVFPHLRLLKSNNRFTIYVSFIGSDLLSSPNFHR